MTSQCVKRLRMEITEQLLHPISPLLHVKPREDDICHLDALIIGPEQTPYQDGYFHFDLRFPSDYPYSPPKVKLLTTDNGRVRFNPNLYACGKVCLSILGTWDGPPWTSNQSLCTVLLSIQTLMNEKPFHNEPGYEDEDDDASEKYNDRVRHETLRVAVAGVIKHMLDERGKSDSFSTMSLFGPVILKHFRKKYDTYMKVVNSELPKRDKKPFEDPFGDMVGRFDYSSVLANLKLIKGNLDSLESTVQNESAGLDLSDDDDDDDIEDELEELDQDLDDGELMLDDV